MAKRRIHDKKVFANFMLGIFEKENIKNFLRISIHAKKKSYTFVIRGPHEGFDKNPAVVKKEYIENFVVFVKKLNLCWPSIVEQLHAYCIQKADLNAMRSSEVIDSGEIQDAKKRALPSIIEKHWDTR
eukprot:13507027-Ditylum_brightwellii.AAC.1